MASSASSATNWPEAQNWERDWWGDCCHTIGEELKQFSYFKRLGLEPLPYGSHKFNFVYDMQGKSVLDIGGGPSSFLLKCINVRGTVLDPLLFEYPKWIIERYTKAGIAYLPVEGERLTEDMGPVDEVWLYNVLQHTKEPAAIVMNARTLGRVVRFFDWLDYGQHPGHPHNLTEEELNEWFEAKGTVEEMNENDAHGRAYYGVFPQG